MTNGANERKCMEWAHGGLLTIKEQCRIKNTNVINHYLLTYLLTYLLYGITSLEELRPPSKEGFFIWFNFSYTYFLLDADWQVISPSPHEPTRQELRYYYDVNMPIKVCSKAYFLGLSFFNEPEKDVKNYEMIWK